MSEIKVTWVQECGTRTTAAVKTGHSLMEAALANNIAGVTGECGGALACATCHVVVDEAPDGTKIPEGMEDDMLDMAEADRQPGSRLSCQIVASEDLDGIVLRIP
ncbi:MAG: 2Fe-2S iron-sulfur cluster binding domain-containing protein [Rhodobacteraceae bacterium]|nr:2Fe-2S iron-sulfur cluster binding domain-containing protein [Paracoccaceae bacterium]